MFDFLKTKIITTPYRELLWYEFYESALAFKAVSLGKRRKRFLRHDEVLVMWRDNISTPHECVIEWLPDYKLVERKE